MEQFKTPILFIVFNRLDTTKKVFETIKKIKPSKLYIAADGPRENKEGEAKKVKEVRDYVMSNINWDCEVKTLFEDKNLGPKKAVVKFITYFFENEKAGIILEHDTLPVKSFYYFCEEMLEKYKDNKKIGSICGFNPVYKKINTNYSYYFSQYNPAWGWATWKDRWEKYDIQMSDWLKFREYILSKFKNKYIRKYMDLSFFLDYLEINNTSWDNQWTYAHFRNDWLTIIPAKNQVLNIGFGKDAVHSLYFPKFLEGLISEDLEFPLKHPELIEENENLRDLLIYTIHNVNIFKVIKLKTKRFMYQNSLLKKLDVYGKLRSIYRFFKGL